MNDFDDTHPEDSILTDNTILYQGFNRDSFNLYFNNVQSLHAHKEELRHELAEMDIIAAAEIWLYNTVANTDLFPGMSFI